MSQRQSYGFTDINLTQFLILALLCSASQLLFRGSNDAYAQTIDVLQMTVDAGIPRASGAHPKPPDTIIVNPTPQPPTVITYPLPKMVVDNNETRTFYSNQSPVTSFTTNPIGAVVRESGVYSTVTISEGDTRSNRGTNTLQLKFQTANSGANKFVEGMTYNNTQPTSGGPNPYMVINYNGQPWCGGMSGSFTVERYIFNEPAYNEGAKALFYFISYSASCPGAVGRIHGYVTTDPDDVFGNVDDCVTEDGLMPDESDSGYDEWYQACFHDTCIALHPANPECCTSDGKPPPGYPGTEDEWQTTCADNTVFPSGAGGEAGQEMTDLEQSLDDFTGSLDTNGFMEDFISNSGMDDLLNSVTSMVEDLLGGGGGSMYEYIIRLIGMVGMGSAPATAGATSGPSEVEVALQMVVISFARLAATPQMYMLTQNRLGANPTSALRHDLFALEDGGVTLDELSADGLELKRNIRQLAQAKKAATSKKKKRAIARKLRAARSTFAAKETEFSSAKAALVSRTEETKARVLKLKKTFGLP